MNIVLGIPSGERADKVSHCIWKWQKAYPDFRIAIYTWDLDTKQRVAHKVNYFYYGQFQSYAMNHNLMAKTISDWDIYICGADDLYPDYGLDKLSMIYDQIQGKILWIRDGFCDAQPTHPIITKRWFNIYKTIFDEKYKHNFCDTDLFITARNSGELVKCFDIAFDHRHYLKTKKKPDSIYKYGNETYMIDKQYFCEKFKDGIKTDIEVPEIKIEKTA